MDKGRLKKILTDYETRLVNRKNSTNDDFDLISLNTFLALVEIEIAEETSPENYREMESIFNRAMRRGPVSDLNTDKMESSVKDKFLRIAEKNYHTASEQIPDWKWKFDDLWKEVKNAFRMSY